MTKFAVVKTGGKQYLVKENEQIVVDRLAVKQEEKVELEKLAQFDDDKLSLQLGKPALKEKLTATVVEHLKGDKIRVAKFKAKVRYRKVRGFRSRLTKIKIVKI